MFTALVDKGVTRDCFPFLAAEPFASFEGLTLRLPVLDDILSYNKRTYPKTSQNLIESSSATVHVKGEEEQTSEYEDGLEEPASSIFVGLNMQKGCDQSSCNSNKGEKWHYF